MKFSDKLNHRVVLNNKEYTILQVVSHHVGNIVAVKLGIAQADGSFEDVHHMMSNVLQGKIENGSKLLPPKNVDEVIKLTGKK